MDSAIVLVLYLFIRPEREVAFREFETEAARIMRRYGVKIDKVIHPTVPARDDPLPHEIQIVSFPSLERFLRGPRVEIAGLRNGG